MEFIFAMWHIILVKVGDHIGAPIAVHIHVPRHPGGKRAYGGLTLPVCLNIYTVHKKELYLYQDTGVAIGHSAV